MNRITKLIFIICTALMLVLPGIMINRETPYISSMDNHVMADFPETWWENPSAMEEYVNDRIGFRDEMITANQYIDYALYHEINHPLYMMGKDGQIFTREWDSVTYQHLDVTDGYPEKMADFLLHLQNYCEGKGVDFCFVLAPSKESIYGEYYPSGYNRKDQPNRSDLVMAELENNGVNVIDPRMVLKEVKVDRPVYNQKYDAGHWNSYGMFVTIQKLYVDFLVSVHPEIGMIKEEEYENVEINHEFLPNSYFRIDDREVQLELEDTQATLELDNGTAEFYSRVWKNEELPDAPKLLVFGDSYFGEADQYFTEHFSEVTMFHIENMWDFYGCVERLEPDIVVVEAGEWVLDTQRYGYFNWMAENFETFY